MENLPNNIPVALLGIEFDGEASSVANSICTASISKNSGDAGEHWCSAGGVGKNPSLGHTLWDTLMVEAMNLQTLLVITKGGKSDID